MTFLVLVGATTALSYVSPIFTKHMDTLGISNNYSGYLFSIGFIFYIIFLLIMPTLSKKVNKKMILTVGIFTSVIGVEI